MSMHTHAAVADVAPDDDDRGIDLEAFRLREGMTFDGLAVAIGVSNASQARRYAIGERWPDPDVIERIEAVTDGAVTLFALHRRRAQWLREHGAPRRVPVTEYVAE